MKHKEDPKVTLQQLADINNSGLNRSTHKYAKSDPLLDAAESGINSRSSEASGDDSDDESASERVTQSMDDCLLDMPHEQNNNRRHRPRRSASESDNQSEDILEFGDCDTPDSPGTPRDSQHISAPLIARKPLPSCTSPSPKQSVKEPPKTCLIICIVITVFVILVILCVVIFEL
jgi:hypothetical protein